MEQVGQVRDVVGSEQREAVEQVQVRVAVVATRSDNHCDEFAYASQRAGVLPVRSVQASTTVELKRGVAQKCRYIVCERPRRSRTSQQVPME
jgi:hypothetical protein